MVLTKSWWNKQIRRDPCSFIISNPLKYPGIDSLNELALKRLDYLSAKFFDLNDTLVYSELK